ncbi:MAG: class II glutamine amidotransferase [Acidimicrobiales bacterium]
MCRLLGYVARPAATLRDALGGDYEAFVGLARDRHGDGWGMAFPAGDGVAVEKEPVGAHDSPAFATAAATRRAEALLVHLRWATMSLPVSAANTHPFGGGRLAFAHNGSIYEMPPLGILTGGSQPLPAGQTDSEQYWLAVQAATERTGNPVRGLAEAVLTVDRTCIYSSLNCLLLTPDILVAVSWFDPDRIAEGLGDDYYDLAFHREGRTTVVASSGWPRPDWTPLPNGSLLVLPRDGSEPRVEDIRAVAPGAAPRGTGGTG